MLVSNLLHRETVNRLNLATAFNDLRSLDFSVAQQTEGPVEIIVPPC